MRWPWRRRPKPEVRPRFGEIRRADGTSEPLVFHPTAVPDVFLGRLAGSEEPVRVQAGDGLTVDVLGPGQSVVFTMPRP